MFNPEWDLRQNLEQAKAQKIGVEVHLRGGKSIAGRVGDLGPHFLLLTSLTGKEFSDALVRLDEVCAVEARVRSK